MPSSSSHSSISCSAWSPVSALARLATRLNARRPAGDDGFSVLEAIVASVVFAIVATASVAAVIQGVKGSATTTYRVTASNLAQQDLQQARSVSDRTTLATLPSASQKVGNTTYSVRRVVTGTCPAVSDPNNTEITVTTTVTWPNTSTGVVMATRLSC